MYKPGSDSLIKILVMMVESNTVYLCNRELNKYITHKMDIFTWWNRSIRPMLLSKREEPYISIHCMAKSFRSTVMFNVTFVYSTSDRAQ